MNTLPEPLVIQAGYLLRPNGSIKRNVQIVVENGVISEISKPDLSDYRGYKIYKYPKGFVVPPFINAHTHLPETLLKGICDDQDLETWLYDYIWEVEPFMTKNQAYHGSLLGIAEMISSGTIGFIDQFYYSESIIQAVIETGMKALLAPSIFEGNAETGSIEKAYKKNLKIYQKYNGFEDRIFVGFGPHATYSLPSNMLSQIATKSKELDTFIHTHLNETESEVRTAMKKWGMSPIEMMNELEVLDRTLAAHCTNTKDNDVKLLKMNETTVLHNLQSNLKLGSGIAPIPKYLDEGINVVLGTDGNASNNNLSILEEVRLSSLIHKGLYNDPKLIPAFESFKMGTSNNSKIFPAESYTGKIEVGAPADLVVYTLDTIRGTPIIDPLSNLVYSISDTDVVLTISNGQVLFHENKFMTLDIENILENAQKSINKMMNQADLIKD